jgi:DNA repair exonuclease SbcCD ATPase subunit
MSLREKQAGMMEQVNNAKENSIRYQEMVSTLRREVNDAKANETSKEEINELKAMIQQEKVTNNLMKEDLSMNKKKFEDANSALTDLTEKLTSSMELSRTLESDKVILENELKEMKLNLINLENDLLNKTAQNSGTLEELNVRLTESEATSEKLKQQLKSEVENERKKWEEKVKDLEEKCRRLVEAGGVSSSGDDVAIGKKIKSAVNGVAGDVYSDAKGVFTAGDTYDGKFVLKQIKGLLKQATKTHSK